MQWFYGLILLFGCLVGKYGHTTLVPSNIDFENAVILDVRTPQEFSEGHVDGSINISSTEIVLEKVQDVARTDQTVVLYCRSGARATNVKVQLEQWGYTQVVNLRTQSGVEQAIAEQRTKK